MKEQTSRFWKCSGLLFGAIALLKGLRLPNVWAVSQLQITYVHGFVKRGLMGELLWLAHVHTLRAVQLFCFAQLFLLLVLLAALTRQGRLLSARGNPALVAAFAGSYAVTFLAHLVGYQDITLYALAIAVVLVRPLGRRFLLAVPVCVFALLVHESFLLSALPLLLFSFVLEGEDDGRRTGSGYAAMLVLLCVAVTLGLALRPSLSPEAMQEFKRETLARAPYAIDARVLEIVGWSTADNLRLNLQVISRSWWWWAELAVASMVLGPLAALLFFSATRALRGRLLAAYCVASFAPLLLNVIGWDNVRWAVLCALNLYINLALVSRSSHGDPLLFASTRQRQAALLTLGLGLASGYGLMDGRKVNPYPFFPQALRPAVLRHDGAVGGVL